MKFKFRGLHRASYVIGALAFLVAVVYPALNPSFVSAAQLATRSITLSDSGPSGGAITSGVGSGTGVTYEVGFTTSVAAQSLVIDFCAEDPIIADTCTKPTGLTAASAALATVSGGGNITSAGWTATVAAGQVKLAKNSGSATSVGAQKFDLTGITNPSTTGTFYARIYTYANATFGTYVGPAFTGAGTGPGNYIDYGGIALSTNQIISITARVQESLTFCVSGADPSTWTTVHDCSDTQASVAPALILGHGTPTAVLDSSVVDTGSVYSQISTNATSGAAIAMRNSNTTCGGLSADGGTTCAIPAVASGIGSAASAIAAGTAAFGLHVDNGVADAGGGSVGAGTGTVTANSNYNGGASTYGMDTVSGSTGGEDLGSVTGTFGDLVATVPAPCYHMNNTYTFAATAGLTTPAGIYVASIDLIATGTF